MSTPPEEYYAFDDYRLSIRGNEIKLYSGHHQVQLRLDEARVLRSLFDSRPNLVEKATLGEVIGNEDEGVLRKVVLGLRKALSDPREEGRIIKTERGKGYHFVADAWPESHEVFHANIDKSKTPEIVQERPQPEPVVTTLAAEEQDEDARAKSEEKISPADADKENAPPETDATRSQPTVEREVEAASVHRTPLPTLPPTVPSNDSLNTFEKWMLGPGRLPTAIAFVCVLTVFVFSAKGYRDGWEGLHALVSGAQLILLFIALFYPLRGAHSFKETGATLTEDIKNSTGCNDPDEWSDASRIAERVLDRYKGYWLGVLFAWFCLYLSLTLTGLPGLGLNCPIDGSRFCVSGMKSPLQLAVKLQDQSDESKYLRAKMPEQMQQQLNDYHGSQPPPVEIETTLVDVFNRTLSDRGLFDVAPDYFTRLGLSKQVIEKLPDEEVVKLNRAFLLRVYPDSAQDVSTRNYSIGLRIFTTLLNSASSLLIFLCFNILNKPKKIKSGAEKVSSAYLYAGVALVFLVALAEALMVIYSNFFQVNYTEVLQGWSYVSGFFGGVAMALYFGRLQSVFLGAPGWLVVLLFVYTLIQSLFFFLEEREEVAVVLIDFALLMKCLLFLYMIWLFKSGRLLFYLVRVRLTYKRVIGEFGIFRRILDEKS